MKSKINRKVFICPQCGVPNIAGDRKCMYCDTKFTGIGALRCFVTNIFRKDRKGGSASGNIKINMGGVLKKITGALLLLAGIFLFVMALMDGSFKNWIVAVILLVYGSILVKR